MTFKWVSAIAAASIGLFALSANAITWGEPDGEDHPHVGLLVFDDELGPAWRCSGTLLSPTVMLTAGHCTYGAVAGRVRFESDVESGIPDNGYPGPGPTSIEFTSIHTHPQYVDAAFFLYDVGVVILSEPMNVDTYGELPELGVLDGLATRRGLQNQLFDVVGYGLQGIVPNPNTIDAVRVRYAAEVMLIDVNGVFGVPAGTSVTFSGNRGNRATGGTCFGDSGGPTFMNGNVVVAVTSFGVNPNCVGNGGGYRIDKADDQDFINSFLGN